MKWNTTESTEIDNSDEKREPMHYGEWGASEIENSDEKTEPMH